MDGVRQSRGQIPMGMRAGERQLKSASLRVSVPESIPEHMRAGTREISNLFVPAEDRGKRLATALMNFVCQEADANRLTLLLTVQPYDEGGPDAQALKSWYAKFGFVELQDSDAGTIMARRVHVPEASNIIPVALAVRQALH
jgi:GNAT superfamily N-acetyltransferase